MTVLRIASEVALSPQSHIWRQHTDISRHFLLDFPHAAMGTKVAYPLPRDGRNALLSSCRADLNAIAYDSRQFTSGEFFMYGIPASIILMIVVGLATAVLWPIMGMPVTVPR
jgi:hypothetical protein